jgi:putative addiction module component (TIGR02574 family)
MRADVWLVVGEREAENVIMSTVRQEIESLSVADRLQLLEEIWNSLVETPDAIPVTAAQRRELERRRRAHARNPSAAKSWTQVRARLRRRK